MATLDQNKGGGGPVQSRPHTGKPGERMNRSFRVRPLSGRYGLLFCYCDPVVHP